MNWLIFTGTVVSAAVFATIHVLLCVAVFRSFAHLKRAPRGLIALTALLFILPAPYWSLKARHQTLTLGWGVSLLTYLSLLAGHFLLEH